MEQPPIILDGGAQMVTIHLPSHFTKDEQEEGKFSVSPEPETERFQSIVITDTKTGRHIFTLPLRPEERWKIEIK